MINASQFGTDGAAIQQALDAASQGGGAVYVPAGDWLCATPLIAPAMVRFFGDGPATCLRPTHQSATIQQTSQVNGSTGVFTTICDMRIEGPANSAHDSVGVRNVAGSYLRVERLMVQNRGHGVQLDQSEVCSVVDCYFETGTSGVWLVNGADVTPGSKSGFTNVHTIERCAFNAGRFGVLDDGGDTHSVVGCNFNGHTEAAIRAAGANGLSVLRSTFEGCAVSLFAHYQTLSGVGAGQCLNVRVEGNKFHHGWQPRSPILWYAGGPLIIEGNGFTGCPKRSTGLAWGVEGAANAFKIEERANSGDIPEFRTLDHFRTAGSAESYAGL